MSANRKQLIRGIHALAVIDAIWLRDRERAVQDEIDYIYAIDTDVIKFFSQPARMARYLSLPGLIEETPQSGAPELSIPARGLAELMGQFFLLESDILGSKILFEPTVKEFSNIWQGVQDKYLNEISTTQRSGGNAKIIISGVLDKLEKIEKIDGNGERMKLLRDHFGEFFPAIFSDGATSERRRILSLFDQGVSKSALTFSAQDSDVNAGLVEWSKDERLKDRADIFAQWKSSIEKTFPEGAVLSEHEIEKQRWDAEVLTSVECCNKYFKDFDVKKRVVFVTGAERLFSAFRYRWDISGDHRVRKEVVESFGQFVQGGRHYAAILSSSVSERSSLLEYDDTLPLRELRYFLADPRFIGFVVGHHGEARGARMALSSGITDWLDAFLVKMNKEPTYIANNFYYAIGLSVPSDFRPVDLLEDSESDIRQFSEGWNGLLRQAVLNYVLKSETLLVKRALEIVRLFLAFPEKESDLNGALNEYLDDARGKLSLAASNLSILALTPKQREAAPRTPPLVLCRFNEPQRVLRELLKGALKQDIDSVKDSLKKLKTRSLSDRDHGYHQRYLELLVRAYCFAIFKEWRGALYLAGEAFRAATLEIYRNSRSDDEDILEGREAAYLAVYAFRQAGNFKGLDDFIAEGIAWLDRLRNVLELEDIDPKVSARAKSVHSFRYDSEVFAHELTSYFHLVWNPRSSGVVERSQLVHMRELGVLLVQLLEAIENSEIPVLLKNDAIKDCDQDLVIACLYVWRQNLVNLFQFHCILEPELIKFGYGERSDFNIVLWSEKLEFVNGACLRYPDELPESALHEAVIAIARMLAGNLSEKDRLNAYGKALRHGEIKKKNSWGLQRYHLEKWSAIANLLSPSKEI